MPGTRDRSESPGPSFIVFMTLMEYDVGLRPRDISRITGLSMGSVKKALKTLERKGLVEKKPAGYYVLVRRVWV